MKSKLYIITLCLGLVFSCGSDDDPVAMLNVTSLKIVEQATNIEVTSVDCIDPSKSYEIEIVTARDIDGGDIQPLTVQYTVNGAANSVTFTAATVLRNPINLVSGNNTVQLVESGQSINVRLIAEPEFQVIVP